MALMPVADALAAVLNGAAGLATESIALEDAHGRVLARDLAALRSVVDTLTLHYSGRRVLIVAHQVVVLCMRYLIEEMDEQQILDIDAEADVANCAVTEYALEHGDGESSLRLQRYNYVAPLEHEGAPVTSEPDQTPT